MLYINKGKGKKIIAKMIKFYENFKTGINDLESRSLYHECFSYQPLKA